MAKALATARNDYVVQPGDTFRVSIFRGGRVAGEYSQEVTVQPDGRFTLVAIRQPLEAAGFTLDEIRDRVQEEYQPLFETDVDRGADEIRVALQFLTTNSADWLPDQVYVTGQVRRGVAVRYRKNMTVMQAITEAGGWLPTGDADQTVVTRQTSEGQTITREVDLIAVVRHYGDDIELLPGDIVYVPFTMIARVNLWVEFYIRGMLPINPSTVLRLATVGY